MKSTHVSNVFTVFTVFSPVNTPVCWSNLSFPCIVNKHAFMHGDKVRDLWVEIRQAW